MEANLNSKGKFLSKCWIYAATAFVMLAAAACNSGSSLKKSAEKPAEQNSSSSSSSKSSPDPGIDLNCVFDHIQNPTEAFHYSYKKDGPNFVENEADITPQTIDGSFKNNSISRPVHGVRSDKDSWQTAWSGLMGASAGALDADTR